MRDASRDEQIIKKGSTGAYLTRRIVTTDSHIYFCQVSAPPMRCYDPTSIMLVHTCLNFGLSGRSRHAADWR